MARGLLPISQFTDALGVVLSNGYVTVRLNKDAKYEDLQVCAGMTYRMDLGVDGKPLVPKDLPVNSDMSPNDTVYVLDTYDASGAMVTNNVPVVVTG